MTSCEKPLRIFFFSFFDRSSEAFLVTAVENWVKPIIIKLQEKAKVKGL